MGPLSLVHTSYRLQQLLQRARSLQIIGNFVSPPYTDKKVLCPVSETRFLHSRVSLTLVTLTDYHAYPFCITTPGTTSQWNYLVAKVDKYNCELHWLFRSQNYSVSVTRVAPEIFLFLLQRTATVAGCSTFAASLNEPIALKFNVNKLCDVVVCLDAVLLRKSESSKSISRHQRKNCTLSIFIQNKADLHPIGGNLCNCTYQNKK